MVSDVLFFIRNHARSEHSLSHPLAPVLYIFILLQVYIDGYRSVLDAGVLYRLWR